MRYIALTGTIYAGKSSLARSLESRGYHLINFTDLLKRYAVRSLNACGKLTTLEDILKDKAAYRALLQELGEHIGFSSDPKYVLEVLGDWDGGPCVFDNVRSEAQWRVLHDLGFGLVEVQVEQEVQTARASNLGVAGEALEILLKHPIEGALRGLGNVRVDGGSPPDMNARLLEEF